MIRDDGWECAERTRRSSFAAGPVVGAAVEAVPVDAVGAPSAVDVAAVVEAVVAVVVVVATVGPVDVGPNGVVVAAAAAVTAADPSYWSHPSGHGTSR